MADAGAPGRASDGPVRRDAGSFGPNAWLVDDMYDRYLVDPNSVSESWRDFFSDFRPSGAAAPTSVAVAAPPARPADAPPGPAAQAPQPASVAAPTPAPAPVAAPQPGTANGGP